MDKKKQKYQDEEENDVWVEPEAVSPSIFFINNIVRRHLYISPFIKFSIFNPKHKKITILFIYLTLQIFSQALMFSLNSYGSNNVHDYI